MYNMKTRVTSVCPGPKVQCPGKNYEWNDGSSSILPNIFIIKLQLSKKKFLLVQKIRIIFLPFQIDVGCLNGRSSSSIASELWVKGPGQGKENSPWLKCSSLSWVGSFGISFICQQTNVAANISFLQLNWIHSAVCKISITGPLL